jgi:hypothetical protein
VFLTDVHGNVRDICDAWFDLQRELADCLSVNPPPNMSSLQQQTVLIIESVSRCRRSLPVLCDGPKSVGTMIEE